MYACDVSGTLASSIGATGLSDEGFAAAKAKVAAAVARMGDKHRDGSFPLGALLTSPLGMAEMQALATPLLKDTSDLIVLGIGGSSLGGQALAQLTGWGLPGHQPPKAGPQFHFPENLDALTFERLLSACDLRTTRFLVISKSGGTAETLSQMLRAMSAIDAAGGGKFMKHHFGILTGSEADNPLRQIAREYEFPCLAHQPIGGRFSALATTGLLPAMMMGLDVSKLRTGAKTTFDLMLSDPASPVAIAAAASFGLLQEKGINQLALTSYDDRLQRFGLWFRQLVGESLGKEGRGITPLAGIGPVDQHSQLQLYLAGANDKLHTIITRDVKGEGVAPADHLANGPFAAYAGRTIGDLLEAEQRATIETLALNGRPVLSIHMPRLDEESLGALLMHFMLKTILLADLMGVDPYDQPAVEQGKVRARAYLAGERPEA
ncbi:MAG: glucose-6-phosphate isomerase [Parvibaculum sp.]